MKMMNSDSGLAAHFSDEESDEDKLMSGQAPSEIQGVLCKWTNYIHGWQDRYFVLRDGTMSYYRSQGDASYGCRGSISVNRAVVKPHEIDECRFDVCLNDCVWYLRTSSQDEKHQWVDAIELQKEGLRRHGSAMSLASASLSTASTKKTKGGRSKSVNGNSLSVGDCDNHQQEHQPASSSPPPTNILRPGGLREKLAELDTYRDILIKQMDTLQTFFDACTDITKNSTEVQCNGELPENEVGEEANEAMESSPINEDSILLTREMLEKHGGSAVDFRGEALTFKATTAGIIQTLAHCVEVMNQREEAFKRKLERETDRRMQVEEKLKELRLESDVNKGGGGSGRPAPPGGGTVLMLGGPDYEEGPHSVMGEEDFYDAVESTLDKLDEEDQFRERLRQRRNAPSKPSQQHPLLPEIEKVTEEQLGYAMQNVTDEGSTWLLFAEEGEMKLYRREVEVDGVVMDPCKALHKVQGVTAHEMAHHFWTPEVRFEWETTLEQLAVLDKIDSATLIFLQVHTRVWPIAQRDALFWSHIRRIPNDDPLLADQNQDPKPHDTWIISNKSTEHPDAVNDGKCVRIDLTVCFVCQTFITPPLAEGETVDTISRDRLLTKIIYCSNVNPGGWVPASVVRTVFKREYPKFVKRFSQYVADKCRDQPIAFDGLVILNPSKIWRG